MVFRGGGIFSAVHLPIKTKRGGGGGGLVLLITCIPELALERLALKFYCILEWSKMAVFLFTLNLYFASMIVCL